MSAVHCRQRKVTDMNSYVTGAVIRELRERSGLTQAGLAEKLHVSDKTVSKWETGRGYPDISLLSPIAEVFRISVGELLSGVPVRNTNVSANLEKTRFYVCPVCGNVLTGIGEAAVSCHGIPLPPLDAEPAGEQHCISVERVENEYYVRVTHEMTRQHFISFLAAVSCDRVQLVKLYPEGGADARFRPDGVRYLYAFCNRDGLFRREL